MALGCLVVCVTLLPAGSFPTLENFIEQNRIRIELSAAISRWQAHAITDYGIDLEGDAFSECFIIYSSRATLFVSNNELISATAPSDKKIDNTAAWLKSCQYDRMLIPQMFQRVEQILKTINPARNYLHVTFDSEYGFISKFEVGCYVESDCIEILKFSNFHPVNPK